MPSKVSIVGIGQTYHTGKRDDVNQPVRPHFLPICAFVISAFLDKWSEGETAPLIAAVGCDRGCDFS